VVGSAEGQAADAAARRTASRLAPGLAR